MIEPCPWSEARPRLGDTIEPGAAEIDEEIATGQARAWRVFGGRLYMVTRVECGTNGQELVIIAARGRDMVRAIDEIKRRAASRGIKSVRFHTQSAAFGRLAQRYGFSEAERVYRVKV